MCVCMYIYRHIHIYCYTLYMYILHIYIHAYNPIHYIYAYTWYVCVYIRKPYVIYIIYVFVFLNIYAYKIHFLEWVTNWQNKINLVLNGKRLNWNWMSSREWYNLSLIRQHNLIFKLFPYYFRSRTSNYFWIFTLYLKTFCSSFWRIAIY